MRFLASVVVLGLAWSQAFYHGYCGSCHLPNARGVPGLYPPLQSLGGYLCRVEGRRYATRVVLYGLVGPIEVEGVIYRGTRYMPSFGALLDDETVALILNDLLRLLHRPYPAFTAAEVKRYRSPRATPNDMFRERGILLNTLPRPPCGQL